MSTLPSGGKRYIVEHLEPEMGEWSQLEYITISSECAKTGSKFYLTSIAPSLMENLPPQLQGSISSGSLIVTSTEVSQLPGLNGQRVCLLDPAAQADLKPEDGDIFDFFVFGGILGDDPPRDRTSELRKYGYQGRRLGPVQMTTDTAVRVTRLVVENKKTLDNIPYVDFPELKLSKHESTEMPFRYVVGEDGQPIMPEGMMELIKKDSDKSFDF
ncbi:SAM-dependent RNA methyltransferase [Kalaharituber pfeilii]|nr:SAM-dependent RNA methyltransferase [Kalaharituber pfeilii]